MGSKKFDLIVGLWLSIVLSVVLSILLPVVSIGFVNMPIFFGRVRRLLRDQLRAGSGHTTQHAGRQARGSMRGQAFQPTRSAHLDGGVDTHYGDHNVPLHGLLLLTAAGPSALHFRMAQGVSLRSCVNLSVESHIRPCGRGNGEEDLQGSERSGMKGRIFSKRGFGERRVDASECSALERQKSPMGDCR